MTTFEQVVNEIIATHNKKNNDYGDAFHQSFNEFGPISAIVRINDKNNRIKKLIKKKEFTGEVDESITDTLLDMAAYAIMTIVELENSMADKQTKQ